MKQCPSILSERLEMLARQADLSADATVHLSCCNYAQKNSCQSAAMGQCRLTWYPVQCTWIASESAVDAGSYVHKSLPLESSCRVGPYPAGPAGSESSWRVGWFQVMDSAQTPQSGLSKLELEFEMDLEHIREADANYLKKTPGREPTRISRWH
jgi:hypothetical protein